MTMGITMNSLIEIFQKLANKSASNQRIQCKFVCRLLKKFDQRIHSHSHCHSVREKKTLKQEAKFQREKLKFQIKKVKFKIFVSNSKWKLEK